MAGERQARLADRIRVILAERLEKGLRDPRLGFVTITDVRVTGDLQHASVFYTVLGTEEERESLGRGAEVGDRDAAHRGRQAPQRAAHPVARVHPRRDPRERRPHRRPAPRSARARRRPSRASPSSATYAGDADPYVKPREFDDDEDEPRTPTEATPRPTADDDVRLRRDQDEPRADREQDRSARIGPALASPCRGPSARQAERPVGCLGQPVGDERVDRPVALARGQASPRAPRRPARRGPRHPAASSGPRRAPAGRCPRSAPAGGGRRPCRGSPLRASAQICATGHASHRGARAVQTVAPELHRRRVDDRRRPSSSAGQDRRHRLEVPSRRRARLRPAVDGAGEHAPGVRVDDRMPLAVREDRHRARRVVADAAEREERHPRRAGRRRRADRGSRPPRGAATARAAGSRGSPTAARPRPGHPPPDRRESASAPATPRGGGSRGSPASAAA